jgi:sterol 3beta-glucosyltransferase
MLEDVFTHQSTAGAINRWRRDVLGLAPVPRRHLTRHRDAMTRATLYGYSPAVLTRPEEWPSNVYVTGFWFLDQPEVWTPGPVLRNFLAAGPPPVYIGFGSMALPDSAKTMQKIAAALLQTGQRAIIAMGVHTSPIQDSENIFILREDVPQDWLFPQVSVVIHHGGVGTMAAAMRAGKPTLVIPINYDQPFWGEIVALLGLGPEAMPARHISVKKLGTAIQKLGTDLNFHHNAVELSKQINAENGVVAAIHVMEEATTECFLP